MKHKNHRFTFWTLLIESWVFYIVAGDLTGVFLHFTEFVVFLAECEVGIMKHAHLSGSTFISR
jgi:hypothetical protein